MRTYRSSSLKYFANYCPAALGFLERHEPADRSIFGPGIAAHALLQAIGEETARANGPLSDTRIDAITDAVARTLISSGRVFDGEPEPPIEPDSVFAGIDVARNWLSYKEILPNAIFETGLGMTFKGNPCEYDHPDCRYKALIDVRAINLNDEGEVIGTVCDYKSSWHDKEQTLDTIQLRGQAVLLWLHKPDIDVIEMRVENLRLGQTFSQHLRPADPIALETLTRWRANILQTCDAADITRTPRPGIQCATCPYTARCPASLVPEPDEIVSRYLHAEGIAQGLKKTVQELAKKGEVSRPYGRAYYKRKVEAQPDDNAVKKLVQRWHGVSDEQYPAFVAEHGAWLGLVAAMKPGVTQLREVAYALFPKGSDPALRAEWVQELLKEKIKREFKTERVDVNADTDAAPDENA